ncbi:MAG: hypothetical protein FWE32_10815 [Oscillospiraceae bacterium]|nr:hypothetical protein [Oscillospiraceae bacterium]
MIEFSTSGDISIEVNGKKLAVAQSYRARTRRESRSVEAFGQREPVGTATGRTTYQIDLSRVQLLDEAAGDGIDFYELSGFALVIAKPGERVIYSGCEWSEIDEAASLGGTVLEGVALIAAKRMVIR